MARFLYLRFLVGGLNVLFVLIVVVLTMTVSLTLSMNTIRTNAEQAVTRLGTSVVRPVNDFFESPKKRVLDTSAQFSAFPFDGLQPIDDPTWGDVLAPGYNGGRVLADWTRTGLMVMKDSNFNYMSIRTYFADGSTSWIYPYTFPASYTANATYAGKTVALSRMVWPVDATNTSVPRGRRVYAHTLPHCEYDAVATALLENGHAKTQYAVNLAANAGDLWWLDYTHAQKNLQSDSVYYQYVNGENIQYFSMHMKVLNASGYRLGFVYLGLQVDKIGDLLTQGELTPDSRVFVYDQYGFLLAGSSKTPFYTIEQYVGAAKPHRGCSTTNESHGWAPSDEQRRVCRFHITNMTYTPLSTGAQSSPDFFANPPASGRLRLIEGQYFYVAQISSLVGVSAWNASIVMVVPEKDLLGDAEKILPACLGAAAAVVVFVVILSFAMVWISLHPLQGIAERMGKAARFEEGQESEVIAVSPIVEIGDLQRAFGAMRDELARIRAFVPQHLLRITTDEDAEVEDGSFYSVASDEGSCRLSATGYPTQQGSGWVGSASGRSKYRRSLGQNQTDATSTNATSTDDNSGRTGRRGRSLSDRSPGSAGRGHGTLKSPPQHAKDSRVARAVEAAMRRETVSVLVVNLRGFHHATAAGVDPAKVASVVDVVMEAVREGRGVIDAFHGDRFTASFNATRPCASHGIRAAVAASKIAGAIATKGHELPATCGVSSGTAYVGNLGNASIKSFAVVGPVVSQAVVLERLCKLYAASCLVPQRLFDDLRSAAAIHAVDLIQLPFASKPCLIGSVGKTFDVSNADDEWMYQLQQQQQLANAHAKHAMRSANAQARAAATADPNSSSGKTSARDPPTAAPTTAPPQPPLPETNASPTRSPGAADPISIAMSPTSDTVSDFHDDLDDQQKTVGSGVVSKRASSGNVNGMIGGGAGTGATSEAGVEKEVQEPEQEHDVRALSISGNAMDIHAIDAAWMALVQGRVSDAQAAVRDVAVPPPLAAALSAAAKAGAPVPVDLGRFYSEAFTQ